MLRIPRLSPFLRAFIATSATSFATGVAIVIITHVVAKNLTPEGFGAFSLSRRLVAVISPFTTMSMGVALARQIAVSPNTNFHYGYLIGAVILSLGPSVTVLIGTLAFSEPIGLLLFRDVKYTQVCIATLTGALGYSFYVVLYSFYRGRNLMPLANLWTLATIVVLPTILVCSLAKGGDVFTLVMALYSPTFLSAVPLIVYLIIAISRYRPFLCVKVRLLELLGYGLPRVPSGLALAALFALGSILAPYQGTIRDAGYLAPGQACLGLAESALGAFGIVVLPWASHLFVTGKASTLRERIADTVILVIQLCGYLALHLIVWSDFLISVWLGSQFGDAVMPTRIVLLGLVPYMMFVMLRSFLDAVEKRPMITYALIVAFGSGLVSSLLLSSIIPGVRGLAIGLTLGISVLGILTLHYLWRHGWLTSLPYSVIGEAALLNAMFLLLSIGFRIWASSMFQSNVEGALGICTEIILFLIYLVLLYRLRTRWILETLARISMGPVYLSSK